LIKFFDHIITGSEHLRSEVINLGCRPSKVTTIHNAIDTNKVYQSMTYDKFKNKFGLNENNLIVGTVGRISKEKGQIYLLKAAKIVLKKFSNIKFVFIGDGELKSELITYATLNSLTDNAIFTGYYENLHEIFNAIDIFVIPSLTESLPLALLEAMAAGKPIISTNVGGIPEIIKNYKTGILVKPKDCNDTANAIIYMIKNKKQMNFMGNNAKALVSENFSTDKFVGKTEELYSRLIIK
jgi:glycosyltransferase involved in cell wall biosynthesis